MVNFEWKEVVEPVMQQYTESTDGSYIEWKESAMVWHHRDADPDFGSWQAKELLDHLESVLANQPVTVKSGAHIVEVKPKVNPNNNIMWQASWIILDCFINAVFELPASTKNLSILSTGCEQGCGCGRAAGNDGGEGCSS
jgi:hypothetical protein